MNQLAHIKQSVKQEYRSFLDINFKALEIRAPLFYNWPFSLRFDLQTGETGTDEYFIEVARRATTLFEAVFSNDEALFLVVIDYQYKRRKVRSSNYIFKQIQDFTKSEANYLNPILLYKDDGQYGYRRIAVIKLAAERLNYQNILMAIANTDFPPRQPRLDRNSALKSKEVYFLNIDRKLIFHMYDDRGLDIIAADIETLRPIYKKYNGWIFDYDRKEIDGKFKQQDAV